MKFVCQFSRLGVLLALMPGCTGTILSQGEPRVPGSRDPNQTPGTPPQGTDESVELPGADLAAQSAPRRLTSEEYDNVLVDLLGDLSRNSALVLPPDTRTPFDNDYSVQIASQALIEGVELLAADASTRLLTDVKRRDRVVGCVPKAAEDLSCLRTFIASFGRRTLRRPLADDEIAAFAQFSKLGKDAGDFYIAIDAVIRVLLQDPEFLYRIENGVPVDGKADLYVMSEFETATRLAFFLWGSGPDDRLLDAASNGNLRGNMRELAAAMLDDPRARRRVARFHAQWLTWESAPLPSELSVAMRAETNALLDRVLFTERRPWADLLRSSESFVTPALAEHYGLTYDSNEASAWTSYDGTKRRGLLSQASFLASAGNVGDTSPTRRGKLIRERLFCQDVPPPPPEANADDPPKNDSECKEDRYAVHRSGTCANCHAMMDPIGFGLENYDLQGRYRETDDGKPNCKIAGTGEITDIGVFRGPAELSDLMIDSGFLGSCIANQTYRYATGRSVLADTDAEVVDILVKRQGVRAGTDLRYDLLLLDLASSPAFVHRRVSNSEVSP
jgi:Protein of unknown function (DUF1588)/Protein of unknown function (DUF1592)/Protein of unknown function (DUF1595)/Protein of unknown function (DUF1587)